MNLIFLKYFATLYFLLFLPLTLWSQEQRVADSLKKIYSNSKFLSSSDKMELLRNLSFNEVTKRELGLQYANELIVLATKEKNYLYLQRGYYQKGNKHQVAGDYVKALAAFFKSLEVAEKFKFIVVQGTTNMAIADVYSMMGNAKNAEIYYSRAIELLRKTDNTTALARVLLNAGDEYLKNKKYEKALVNFKESGALFIKDNNLIGTAYTLGNKGMVYAEQGKDNLALQNISQCIALLEKQEDYYGISDYLIYMAAIYQKKNDSTTALLYAKRSLALAQKYGLKDQVSKSNLKLYELYQKDRNDTKALLHYKDYITYRDSVTNFTTIQKVADLRTNHEVSQKQIQVNLLKKDGEIQQLKVKRQRNLIYATGTTLLLIFILALGLFRRNKFIQKTKSIIEKEKNRSDKLLLNILPEETAKELKESGKVQAKRFDLVTVMFTDFKSFSKYAGNLKPEDLVESVDYYFSKFDSIIEKYGLEKIKTIGDSYMCAGGLPFATEDHALKTIQAAMEIQTFVSESLLNNQEHRARFEIRIGINSGPVVAGVVGTKKFAYDIWGDTVNIASRMESSSEPGRINISQNTFALVQDYFTCDYRGEIEVKDRGILKMYFVNGNKQ